MRREVLEGWMHTCAYCGRRLPLLHRVVGGYRYCSKEHAQLHRKEVQERLASVFRMPQQTPGAVETGPVAGPDFEPETAPDSLLLPVDFDPAAGTEASELAGEAPGPPGAEVQDPFKALREALLAAASAEPPVEPSECAGSAPVAGDPDEAIPPPDRAWGGSLELFEAAEDNLSVAPPGSEFEPSAAAWLLPLPGPAPAASVRASCRMLPPRPPRRRIIVPTHRTPRPQRQLPCGGLLPLPPRPALPAELPSPGRTWEAGRAPVMLERGRAVRIGMPGAPGVAAPAPVQPELPLAIEPVSSPVALVGPGKAPESLPGGRKEAPLPRLALAVADRAGLAPGCARSFRPRPVSRLPEPFGRRTPAANLAALMNGAIQPFRLHRLPPRPFAWRPEPSPERKLPAKLAPVPLAAPSGVLFIPRAAMMPVRPAYLFGPAPGQTPGLDRGRLPGG